jgi:GNAT superfamily N-acetyltransferase
MLRRIERASLRAWPGVESVRFEGWELRFSGGFTRRANSVQPLAAAARPTLAARVSHCEAWYAARGVDSVFRLTTLTDPGLDGYLAERGYARANPTAVLYREVPGHDVESGPGTLAEREVGPWLESYAAVSGLSTRALESMRRILAAALPRQRFGVLVVDEQSVCCGLAVVDDGLVGLFDIVTAPAQRRRGHGASLVAGLLRWGAEAGSRIAYLQVVRANLPALRLYEKLGFEPAYEYWYRVKSPARSERS